MTLTFFPPARGDTPTRVSFLILAALLVVAGVFHLTPPLLACLFAFFALNKLQLFRGTLGKWLAVALFLIVLSLGVYAMGYLLNASLRALPEIADTAIPSVIQWAKEHHIELPFTDYDSLKEVALGTVKAQVGSIAKFARGAASQTLFVLIGAIVAIGIFFKPSLESEADRRAAPGNLYSLCCEAVSRRFQLFYQSFATVMGAQILISAINTVLTGIFALVMHLPYGMVVVGTTFLCGLVPVVGNLISNTIIVGVGITVSSNVAIAALVFLVAVHKLEYFLNSKIVGDRIRNPFWLTLMALIVGEKLMGIPGMVLAPVILHYIKIEASAVRPQKSEEASEPLRVASG